MLRFQTETTVISIILLVYINCFSLALRHHPHFYAHGCSISISCIPSASTIVALMTFCPPHLAPYVDRSVVAHRFPLYHPYQYDSDPESYHNPLPSRVPRPLPALALKLQDPRQRCDRNLRWNIDWAVAFLVDHLDPKNNPDAATVLKAVRQRSVALHKEGHGLEVPFRIFNTLSNILFAGHLKNAAYLEFRNLHPDVSGATHTQGMGTDPRVKRVSIYLNKDVLLQAPSRDLIGILIHHMIHAYFLVACGPELEKEAAYGRLGHGLHFGKIMLTIKNLLSLNGHPVPCLDFGHSLGMTDRVFFDENHSRQRNPYHQQRHSKRKWYCSHCISDIASLPEGDIDDWYNRVCKPLLTLPESLHTLSVQIYNPLRHVLEEIPRAEATPSTQSEEFIHHGKSVLVPSGLIDNFFSIRRAFAKSGSRYFEISDFIEGEIFLRFLELLHRNTYGPDPKHIYAMGVRGPPVIKSASPGEPYLLTDIKMYKMGVMTGFDELKGTALERMYRHGITHEDPVDLLNALYGDGEPDGDLKAWTRKFLGKTCAGGETEWMGGSSSVSEPSNLAKLECHLLGWKARFHDLRERSSALKYEVSVVRRELVASGMYVSNGVYGGLMGPLQSAPPMAWPTPRPGGYLGLQWGRPEVEMERRATDAAVRAVIEPFLQRNLSYGDGYDDTGSNWRGY